MKLNLIHILALALLISIMPDVESKADPQRLLGENGAYFWSESDLKIEPLYPLAGGRRLMMLWSEQMAETGRRLNFLQLIGHQGKSLYNPPIILNNSDKFTRGMHSAIDRSGNIFVAWEEIEDKTDSETFVFLQKYNRDGIAMWGNKGVNSMLPVNEHIYSWRIYPDELGGVYIIYKNRVTALDANGNLREDWLWQDTDFDLVGYTYPDGIGGFWYSVPSFIFIDWERAEKPVIYNHVNYKGEKLWDEPSWFKGEPSPGSRYYTRVRAFLMMVDNGILCKYSNVDRQLRSIRKIDQRVEIDQIVNDEDVGVGICMVDEKGVFKGENYVHKISERNDRLRFYKLLDGRVLILHLEGDDETLELWTTLYDPLRNNFPWSKFPWYKRSKLIGKWLVDEEHKHLPEIRLKSETGISQTSTGDIIIPVNLVERMGEKRHWSEVYRISLKGKHKWKKPIIIEHMLTKPQPNEVSLKTPPMFPLNIRYETRALPASEDGCWLAAYGIENDEKSRININLYNKKGKLSTSDINVPGYNVRNPAKTIMVWNDDEGNCRILFEQEHKGLTLQTLDPDGYILGDPDGEIIVPLSSKCPLVKSIRIDNQILIAWIPDPFSRRKIDLIPRLSALDLTGEQLWTIDIGDNLQVFPRTNFRIVVAPDKRHILIALLNVQGNYPLLCWFDISKGELVWTKELFRDEIRQGNSEYKGGKSGCEVLIGEDEIYCVFWSHWSELVIMRLNHSGDFLWDELYRRQEGRDDGFIGAAFRTPIGIYVAKQKSSWTRTAAWARNILPEGIRGKHSSSFYENNSEKSSSGASGKLFTLIPGSENLWLVPTVNRELGIQCVDHYSHRLMGPQGKIPQSFEEYRHKRNVGSMTACSDGSDGIWVVWGVNPQVLHLEYENRIITGWSDDGMFVFEGSKLKSTQIFPLTDHKLAVTASEYDYRQSGRVYLLQVLE